MLVNCIPGRNFNYYEFEDEPVLFTVTEASLISLII